MAVQHPYTKTSGDDENLAHFSQGRFQYWISSVRGPEGFITFLVPNPTFLSSFSAEENRSNALLVTATRMVHPFLGVGFQRRGTWLGWMNTGCLL